MTRYVVVVKPPDDHPGAVRVFGPWRQKAVADSFALSVTDKIEAQEAERGLDDVSGWAYVMPLEGARRRDAGAWALRGERIQR